MSAFTNEESKKRKSDQLALFADEYNKQIKNWDRKNPDPTSVISYPTVLERRPKRSQENTLSTWSREKPPIEMLQKAVNHVNLVLSNTDTKNFLKSTSESKDANLEPTRFSKKGHVVNVSRVYSKDSIKNTINRWAADSGVANTDNTPIDVFIRDLVNGQINGSINRRKTDGS